MIQPPEGVYAAHFREGDRLKHCSGVRCSAWLSAWALVAALSGAMSGAMLGCSNPGRKVASGEAAERTTIVALITVEGLGRSWERNVPADAAPVLRALPARNGPPVFTPCPSSVPALASLMSGVGPLVHGVFDNYGSRVPATLPLLAEQLRAAGWRTGGFVANPLLSRVTGLERGFEVFDGSLANVLGSARYYPEVRPAERVVENAATWIASVPAGARAFVWVHLSELGEPRLEGTATAPAGIRERLEAVDRAVGRVRAALRSRGDLGVLFVAGDRGHLAGLEGDLGQGFFLEPETIAVYYAEEPFGGFELPATGRPLTLNELHDRVLRAASLPPPQNASLPPTAANHPVVVSSSSIPWMWSRWPAAVAVAQSGTLFIHDGEWRRSLDLQVSEVCAETDVPVAVQAAARETTSRLVAIPPDGPRLQELRAAMQAAGLRLALEPRKSRSRGLAERRRLVAQLQRARLLAAVGQFASAVTALAPLRFEPDPVPAALVDALMFETLDPHSSGRDWELGLKALAQFGPLPPALHWTAHAALHRKNAELAEKLLAAFLERVPADADALYDRACIRSLRGDVAGAETLLRAAADAGFHAWDYVEIDPDLRNLRADPRYAALRKSLGR